MKLREKELFWRFLFFTRFISLGTGIGKGHRRNSHVYTTVVYLLICCFSLSLSLTHTYTVLHTLAIPFTTTVLNLKRKKRNKKLIKRQIKKKCEAYIQATKAVLKDKAGKHCLKSEIKILKKPIKTRPSLSLIHKTL